MCERHHDGANASARGKQTTGFKLIGMAEKAASGITGRGCEAFV